MLMVVALRYIDKVQPPPANPWSACEPTDRTFMRFWSLPWDVCFTP